MTRTRRTRTTAAAVLVVAALVAGACAGGDDEARPPAEEEPVPTTETTTTLVDPATLDGAELVGETYVAGFPLVVSVRTLQRLGGLLGVNNLFWQSELSGPDSRFIVAPNRDTLYSIAVLDLRGEPMALTLPEVTDRYYTYQFLDAWTESFAYIGTRATGGRAGTWVVTPPGWSGELPDGAERIESPTPQVFLLGRFLVDDEADIANVHAIRRQTTLQPLSALTGDPAAPPPPPLGAPAGTAQDIPADRSFFPELDAALAVNPPTTDHQRALFDRYAAVQADLDPAVLDEGAALGADRIADLVATGTGADRLVNGWSANPDIGTYGDDLETRALVAKIGWGANVVEEALYPVTRVDADGERLDGSGGAVYRITFRPGELPPVEAFWSLSVYGADMFFAPHPSGRYAIGDRTPGLVRGDDGSLTILLSHDDPGDPTANWLPVPDGPFVLMLRLYLPGPALIDGSYAYPPVERLDAP
ncbi:MAG TPA: DUF1254 domain-containing protein [Acidimicrobiales bacterium]